MKSVKTPKNARKRRELAATKKAQKETNITNKETSIADKETPKAATTDPFKRGLELRSTNPQLALQNFRLAVKRSPRHRAAWFQIYRLSVRLGQNAEAKRACLNVIRIGRSKDNSQIICQKFTHATN